MKYEHPELRERLAAEYALGTLRGLARRRFERLLAGDQTLRDLVQAWELRLNLLAESARAEAPPARVWQRVEQRLGPAPTREGPFARWWNSLGFWRGAGLLAMAATAALVLYIAAAPAPTPGTRYVAVLIDAEKKPILVARFDAATRELSVRDLRPVVADPAHSRELWIVPAGGAPKSLGLVQDNQTKTVTLSADQAAAVETAILAISLEQPGGSTTGAPAQVLFTGSVVPSL
jgi:anti-sigma-K factor RskA